MTPAVAPVAVVSAPDRRWKAAEEAEEQVGEDVYRVEDEVGRRFRGAVAEQL